MVHLLLVNGVSPLDTFQLEENEGEPINALEYVHDDPHTVAQLELYVKNPKLYVSNHSALIHTAIGLAFLDLPILLVTIISEHLALINEEFLAEFSETKSWKIAALIKTKATELK